jgi:hypothetical protein
LDELALKHGSQRVEDVNETWRIASTAFASGQPVTLEDLLNRREADFSLKR